jgi:hypothetical protein
MITTNHKAKEDTMTYYTTETIADLEKRRDLLKEIKELCQSLPDDDYMKEVANHYATLKAIEECNLPDEDWMKEVDDHYATLKLIEETDAPSDEEMKEASDHLATLREIAAT